MRNLKSLPIPELYALYAFSKQMFDYWEQTDEESIIKYYKKISDELMDEMNSRIEILFPELNHLIS